MAPDGQVYLTYGTINAPGGPLDILSLSPLGVVTTLLENFDSDRIDRFRVLNGSAVWVPSTDPTGMNPGSLATNVGGSWHVVPVEIPGLPVIEHMMDVAQEPNGDLYACGSHVPDTAFIGKSTDGGITWSEDLAYPSGRADGYNRFNEFRRSGGALVVSKSASPGGHFVLSDGVWIPTDTVVFDDVSGAKIDTYNRVVVPGRGVIRNLSNPYGSWKVSLAADGAVWFTNGTTVYRDPPPA